VIEQRAIAMLGDDGNARLSEIFAQAGVSPIGIRDALTRGGRCVAGATTRSGFETAISWLLTS
jgi:hypothetical protein